MPQSPYHELLDDPLGEEEWIRASAPRQRGVEVTEDSPEAHGRAPVHVLGLTHIQVLHFTMLSPY